MSEVEYLVNEGEAPAFCRTPAADAMLGVIELAREMRFIGAIVGAPGVGKTTTLLHFAESTPGAHYCVMNPTRNSMTAMLATVCESLHCRPTKSNADTHDIICSAVEWGSVEVLLVDEAQHLPDPCLDQLRCIYDQAGLPVVFAGNATLRDRFDGGKRAAFAQLTSRIGPRVELDTPTAADVAALARNAGAHHPKAIAYLERYIAGTAGLRQVAALLKVARKLAGDGDIALSHLKMAAAGLRLAKE